MDEMNVQPVDLGEEIRQGVYLRLAFAPVVLCRPILCELLHRRELHALCVARNLFAVGPFGLRDAFLQIDKLILRSFVMERADRGIGRGHLVLPLGGAGRVEAKQTDGARCCGSGE